MAQVYGWLTMDELKQAAAMERLAALENNKSRTADSLKISRQTLDSIIEAFEKRTAEDKERIRLNNEKLRAITNQESRSFEMDPNTGMSVPVAPAPLKPIELFKARNIDADPLSAAAHEMAGTAKAPNKFMPSTTPSPIIKEKTPLETEAEREHARFAKLDKTPYATAPKHPAKTARTETKTESPKTVKAKKQKVG